MPDLEGSSGASDARDVVARGHSMRVSATERYKGFWDRYEQGAWEPLTFDVLSRFLKRGSYYVDIGGWIGPTVLFAAALGADVVAFEPDNVAHAELAKNVELNTWTARVNLVHAAIADVAGTAILHSSEFGNSESSLVATRVQRKTAVVEFAQSQECITLAAAVAAAEFRFAEASLIKIDIEGGEYSLLPRLVPALKGSKAPLFMSFHIGNVGVDQPTPAARDAERLKQNTAMIECLKDAYVLHRQDKGGLLQPAKWERIEAENAARAWLWGPYLLLPA